MTFLFKVTVGYSRLLQEKAGKHLRRPCHVCDASIFYTDLDNFLVLCKPCLFLASDFLIDGRYSIKGYLGRGNFATVFDIVDCYTKKPYVLKCLKKGFEILSNEEGRILRRASRAGAYSGFGFVKLKGEIQLGTHKGLVLERLEVVDFLPACRSSYCLDTLRKLSFNVLVQLNALHSILKIAHADIKTENIMFSRESGKFKLIDFGNAVALDHLSQYFQDGNICSLQYRAPEIIATKIFNEKIDIWAFGVSLLQLATPNGRHPFWRARCPDSLLTEMAHCLGPVPEGMFAFDRWIQIESADDASHEAGESLRRWRAANLAKITGFNDHYFIDFLNCLLEYTLSTRYSARQALSHPFLASEFPFVLN